MLKGTTTLNFDSKTTKYSLKNALRLCEASALTYKPEQEIKSFTETKWDLPKFKFFDISHTQAFMAANDEIIILAFRGTESIQDWIADARVKFVKGPLGRVHRGFLKALEYVWNSVLGTLHEFQTSSQSIWITGHSLGGALATLATARITERNMKINGLYTFGQPRVGNKTFAKEFDSKFKHLSFRFVNNDDIVTRVPPRAFGYAHIGQVVYFDVFGKAHKDIRCWRRFLDMSTDRIVRSIDRFGVLRKRFPNGLDDHNLNEYLKRIRKNLENSR